jgi:putative ABC transport system substrate-binding protein
MAFGAIGRRDFLGGGLAVASVGLLAGCGMPFGLSTQPARLKRVGYLGSGSSASNASNLAAFLQGLHDLGWVEGQNFSFEQRFADGGDERLPELSAELVRLTPDVILAGGTVAVHAVALATTTIPIVFTAAGVDPVADGLIASLAQPGGNITGLTTYAGQENAKRLQVLREAFPNVSRVAVLWNQTGAAFFRETESAAQSLGVQVVSLELRTPADLGTVLDGAIAGRADGLIVVAGAALALLADRIVEFATRHRLPSMYSSTPFIAAGGLIVFAASNLENNRRASSYVDKILKGANPGELPIERPAKYDFVVNLKTAQALGVTIPQSILAEATELIQ